MRRALVVAGFVGLCAGACQCLQPVDEGRDGGADAGVPDAGALDSGVADAGADGGMECTSATDCAPPAIDGGIAFCGGTPAATCFAGRCITECMGGRTCALTTERCLGCRSPTSSKCGATACSASFTCEATVSWSTCTTGPVVGARFVATRTPTCEFELTTPDGGVRVGEWFDLDVGEAVGHFPGVDGPCIGHDLFTGVPRMLWSCPGGCTFIEMGCD